MYYNWLMISSLLFCLVFICIMATMRTQDFPGEWLLDCTFPCWKFVFPSSEYGRLQCNSVLSIHHHSQLKNNQRISVHDAGIYASAHSAALSNFSSLLFSGYVAPRNLPSTGFFPFLQTLMCNTDSSCSSNSYLEDSKSKSLRQRRDVNTHRYEIIQRSWFHSSMQE